MPDWFLLILFINQGLKWMHKQRAMWQELGDGEMPVEFPLGRGKFKRSCWILVLPLLAAFSSSLVPISFTEGSEALCSALCPPLCLSKESSCCKDAERLSTLTPFGLILQFLISWRTAPLSISLIFPERWNPSASGSGACSCVCCPGRFRETLWYTGEKIPAFVLPTSE